MTLRFSTLRAANVKRLPLFKNGKGEPAHSRFDGSDWSLNDWLTAILGELGETANVIKKVRRGDVSILEARPDIANELSDVMIYSDLLAYRLDFRLFNEFIGDASFEDMRGVTLNTNGPRILADCMASAMAAYGQVAFYASYVTMTKERLQNIKRHLQFGICSLDCAAHHLELDFGNEVRFKFNAVSKRINVPVFINKDEVTDREL